MTNHLVLAARSFYEDIIYSGLREDYSPSRQRKMIRFNQFILLTLIANFVSVISYFSYGLYISALVNLSAAYFLSWLFISISEGNLSWRGSCPLST
ncbi:MAG: hypothetical protein ABUM51_03840 [Bacteroidota bacterium]